MFRFVLVVLFFAIVSCGGGGSNGDSNIEYANLFSHYSVDKLVAIRADTGLATEIASGIDFFDTEMAVEIDINYEAATVVSNLKYYYFKDSEGLKYVTPSNIAPVTVTSQEVCGFTVFNNVAKNNIGEYIRFRSPVMGGACDDQGLEVWTIRRDGTEAKNWGVGAQVSEMRAYDDTIVGWLVDPPNTQVNSLIYELDYGNPVEIPNSLNLPMQLDNDSSKQAVHSKTFFVVDGRFFIFDYQTKELNEVLLPGTVHEMVFDGVNIFGYYGSTIFRVEINDTSNVEEIFSYNPVQNATRMEDAFIMNMALRDSGLVYHLHVRSSTLQNNVVTGLNGINYVYEIPAIELTRSNLPIVPNELYVNADSVAEMPAGNYYLLSSFSLLAFPNTLYFEIIEGADRTWGVIGDTISTRALPNNQVATNYYNIGDGNLGLWEVHGVVNTTTQKNEIIAFQLGTYPDQIVITDQVQPSDIIYPNLGTPYVVIQQIRQGTITGLKIKNHTNKDEIIDVVGLPSL